MGKHIEFTPYSQGKGKGQWQIILQIFIKQGFQHLWKPSFSQRIIKSELTPLQTCIHLGPHNQSCRRPTPTDIEGVQACS